MPTVNATNSATYASCILSPFGTYNSGSFYVSGSASGTASIVMRCEVTGKNAYLKLCRPGWASATDEYHPLIFKDGVALTVRDGTNPWEGLAELDTGTHPNGFRLWEGASSDETHIIEVYLRSNNSTNRWYFGYDEAAPDGVWLTVDGDAPACAPVAGDPPMFGVKVNTSGIGALIYDHNAGTPIVNCHYKRGDIDGGTAAADQADSFQARFTPGANAKVWLVTDPAVTHPNTGNSLRFDAMATKINDEDIRNFKESDLTYAQRWQNAQIIALGEALGATEHELFIWSENAIGSGNKDTYLITDSGALTMTAPGTYDEAPNAVICGSSQAKAPDPVNSYPCRFAQLNKWLISNVGMSGACQINTCNTGAAATPNSNINHMHSTRFRIIVEAIKRAPVGKCYLVISNGGNDYNTKFYPNTPGDGFGTSANVGAGTRATVPGDLEDAFERFYRLLYDHASRPTHSEINGTQMYADDTNDPPLVTARLMQCFHSGYPNMAHDYYAGTRNDGTVFTGTRAAWAAAIDAAEANAIADGMTKRDDPLRKFVVLLPLIDITDFDEYTSTADVPIPVQMSAEAGYTTDEIHPNPAGAEWIGDLIKAYADANDLFDTTPPEIDSAVVQTTGLTTVISFDETVTYASPNASHWSMTQNGNALAISGIAFGSNQVTLTHAQAYQGMSILVSFTAAANRIEDPSGNDMASVVDLAATNNSTVVFDGTAPEISTAVVQASGLTTVISFTETVAYASPSAGHWTLTLDGDPLPITLIAFATNQVTLTHDQAYDGDIVRVSFTSASNRIQDTFGNDLASVVDLVATNNSEEPPLQDLTAVGGSVGGYPRPYKKKRKERDTLGILR
jgi:hypothetical protein